MQNSKKIGIGIGIFAAVVILAIVTNIDDMALDTISGVKITNPVFYEINTKEDFACALGDGQILERIAEFQKGMTQEELRAKYPTEYQQLQEYLDSGQMERDAAISQDLALHKTNEILMVPIMMNEFSINPDLKDFMLEFADGKISEYEWSELEKTDCER